jgi:hypothetical protein
MMHIEPNRMYKLGVTTMWDAEKRLSVETAKQRNFRGIALGQDYIVKTMWSIWVPVDVARKLEGSFKVIKKNVWTRVQYNGITECRYFTQAEVDELLANLRRRFPAEQYGKPRAGYIHVYFDYLDKIKKKVEYDPEPEVQMA